MCVYMYMRSRRSFGVTFWASLWKDLFLQNVLTSLRSEWQETWNFACVTWPTSKKITHAPVRPSAVKPHPTLSWSRQICIHMYVDVCDVSICFCVYVHVKIDRGYFGRMVWGDVCLSRECFSTSWIWCCGNPDPWLGGLYSTSSLMDIWDSSAQPYETGSLHTRWSPGTRQKGWCDSSDE